MQFSMWVSLRVRKGLGLLFDSTTSSIAELPL